MFNKNFLQNIKMLFYKNKSAILLSAQSALLGQIYPSIRGIAIGFSGTERLKLICYLDREPTEDDYDNLGIIGTEICADINFATAEEICICSKDNFRNLDSLDCWIYMRMEESFNS